jgi:hypothetical protein
MGAAESGPCFAVCGMSAHTKGPWEPRQNESGMFVTCVNELHIDSDGDPADICSIENETYFGAEEAWANARLIAAAPQLLEALKAAELAMKQATETLSTAEYHTRGKRQAGINELLMKRTKEAAAHWAAIRAALALVQP